MSGNVICAHEEQTPFFLRSICLGCLLFIGYLFWIMTWTFSFLNSYNNHKNIVMVNTATIFCVQWVQLSWEGGIYDNHCLSFLFIRKAHNEEVLCVYTKNRNPFSHVHLSVRVVYFLYFCWFKHILLSNIYNIGLNTSFTTYMTFSPVAYKHRSDREHDNKCISIYDIEE